MNKKYLYLSVPIFLIISLSLSMSIFANQELVGFHISAIIPENQINKNISYFDLKMTPNQNQDVEIVIDNTSEEKSSFEIIIAFAKTNSNGNISYIHSDVSLADETLLYPLSTIATLDNPIVEVEANSKLNVPIHIKMPPDQYDGIILGGVRVSKLVDKEEEENVTIANRFAYVIGMKLTETDTEVVPKMQLNSIKPTLHNYRNAIAVNIQNTEAVIIDKINIVANIYKENSNTILHSSNIESFKMAPNCNVDYMVDWKSTSFQPGKYRLKMTAKTEDYTWEWDEAFTINDEEAAENNNNALEIVEEKEVANTNLIIIGIILIILLIGFIILLIILGRKKGKRERR